jgi:hypothetical protein
MRNAATVKALPYKMTSFHNHMMSNSFTAL